MTNQEFKELQEFLSKHDDNFKVYVNREPDSDVIKLRICKYYFDTKQLDYFVIKIKETP
jgi:hypothetical protein